MISQELYYRGVRRVLVITLCLNLAVVVAKLVIGLLANSLSVIGDAIHSSTDAINNVVGLLIVRVATAEADEEHPYGHRKFESLAGFSVGGLLWVVCFELVQNALHRLFRPVAELEVSGLTMIGMTVTMLVNLFVYIYERRAGERLGSHYLIADSLHTRSDIYVSATILAGLVLMRMGWPWLDPVLALVVSGLIAHAGWQIFQRTVPVLVDAAPLSSARIQALVMDVPGVQRAYEIRSRSDGQRMYVELNLEVNAKDVYRAHLVTEEVERRLVEALGPSQITIHVEPS
ncbi:MAG: cation diffusion facilitator family transporter [Acidobacteriota bacterium]|nr:cation diffusion facilitator family transporter [Blastocatellia bacterium]MDW8240148.1 cation diffusion facilitator family transporter [Acidobacteriota bacterium]